MTNLTDNTLVIGNFQSNPSTEAFLKKFLSLVFPLSKKIVLVSGDLPPEFSSKIKWIRTAYKTTEQSPTLARIIYYNFFQIYTTMLVANLFRKQKFEIVVFLASVPVLMLFTKLMGKTILLHQGGSLVKQKFGHEKSLRRFFFSALFVKLPDILADCIIVEAQSSLIFQDLQEYQQKVAISGFYVDEHLFYEITTINNRQNAFGYFGGIDENKGAVQFVKAVLLLKDYLVTSNIQVIIGGGGPLFDYVNEFVELNGLSSVVTVTGRIQHTELVHYLNDVKLLVVPSYSEGLPNILLEAMACGTPLLATPVGGIPSVLDDGVTGFLIEDNSPNQIAEGIIRAFESNDLEEIALRGLELIGNQFSFEAARKRYEDIFRKLVRGSKTAT
jgi:glycosyltransferase involved in cell wall biosynthesis